MGKIVETGGSSDKQKSRTSKKCHTRRKVEEGYGDARAGAGASLPRQASPCFLSSDLDDGHQSGDLTDPKNEHPLDDFRLEIGPVLLGHEAFGKIVFLFPKGQLQTLGNRPCFQRLNLGGFQDGKNLGRAHDFIKLAVEFLAVKPTRPRCTPGGAGEKGLG